MLTDCADAEIEIIGSIHDGEGGQVSRSSLNLAERKCLLCGNDARICARSRVHSADELNEKIAAMKEEYELLYD